MLAAGWTRSGSRTIHGVPSRAPHQSRGGLDGPGNRPAVSDVLPTAIERTSPQAPLAGFEPALPPPEGGALSPELQGLMGAKEGYPSRPAGHESVRRYRRETGPPTPIPLVGDPRTARVDRRRRPPGARRRRRRQPARRRPHHGGGRAPAHQGARGLRDQRRAPAGEEGGHQPAGLRRAGRRAAAERGRDRGRRHRGAGVPQHHGLGRSPGRGRGRRAHGRGGVRPQRRARRRADQRRVHLGQPDRAAAPRPHPVGRGRRRAGPGARRGRCRRGAGVLHQRPRVADGQVRRLGRGPGEGRAGAGRRLPGRVRRGGRAAGARRGAGHPRPARR